MSLSDLLRGRRAPNAGAILLVLVAVTLGLEGVALAAASHAKRSGPATSSSADRSSRAPKGAPAPAARSLAGVLAAGGRIRHGARGSFSARGYRMVLGAHGEPRFIKATNTSSAPSVAADLNWSDAFGNVGAPDASTIDAVAVSGSSIYIGGSFSRLSYDAALPANNVAMYNGHGWYSLGAGTANGVNGTVKALAVSGSTVYVGGRFNSAGGASANAIASWNGTKWSALGAGMTDSSSSTPEVDALAVSGTTLYAGGSFDNAGSVAAHSIAAWSGGAWSALGTGIQHCGYFDTPNHCYTQPAASGQVNALAVSSSTVYVGGAFNLAGGQLMAGLAKWTGTAWAVVGTGGSAIDSANSGTVNSIALNGPNIYVAGRFDHIGGTLSSTGGVATQGTSANSIAQWTGSAWKALGSGANNCGGCGSATVDSVAAWNGRLYMSGGFYGAGGDGAPDTAQWNGTTWTPIGPNLDGSPTVLLSTAGGVVAAGGFSNTADSSVTLERLGLWNGSTWSGYGLGLSYGTNAGSTGVVAASNHTLYAGGNFSTAGSTPAHNLAMLSGGRWSNMGGGLSGGSSTPDAILVNGSDVYVGGNFTQAGTTAASHVARWDGHVWHALGSGVDGNVLALAMYNGKLWVGGSFAHAGTVAASDIAIWDPASSTWSRVGGGLNFGGSVNALAGVPAPYGHYMVIGGYFPQVNDGGANPNYYNVNSILYFDTSATITGPISGYVPMGSGTDVGVQTSSSYGPYAGTVDALLVDGTKTFIGGDFDTGGSVASRGFASYDLSSAVWASPGAVGGVSGATVNAILKYGSSYYVAGDFTAAGPIVADDVAQYTPVTGHWAPLGSGLSTGGSFSGASATGLAESADGLYVAGEFGIAGGKAAENLALWTATADPVTASQTVSPTSQVADSNVTFTGTAKNTGASSASSVSMTATLPFNAIFISATPSQGSCARSGRSLSCALGTLAAGAVATVAITVQPIQPASTTNAISVAQSGFTSAVSTSAAVTPQPGHVYPGVRDSGFAPAAVTLTPGQWVQYDFYGPSAHTVVDPIAPCASGSHAAISDYACRYNEAGTYTAKEDGGTTHVATIGVKDVLSPATVAHGSLVSVQSAAATPPSGWGMDVQVLAPGGAWTTIATGSTALTVNYRPAAAGTYQFRSRMRNLTTSAASGFGPAVSLPVS